MAAEVETIMDSAPHVVQALSDYGVTRDQIRACLKNV